MAKLILAIATVVRFRANVRIECIKGRKTQSEAELPLSHCMTATPYLTMKMTMRTTCQAQLISIQNITAVYAIKQPNTFNSPQDTPQYAAAYLGSF